MNYSSKDGKTRQLVQREVLSQADLQRLWRLESGALRIDSVGPDQANAFVRLALPGDLLGVERLVGMTDSLAVRAITPARLVPVVLLEEGHRLQLLMDAVVKGHQRCREVVSLRTGAAAVRIKRLLHMLAHDEQSDASERIACALPTLCDMADVVNASPETVCRVLSSLRQLDLLQHRERRGTLSRTPMPGSQMAHA